MKLHELTAGSTARVTNLHAVGRYRKQLFSMGLVPGAEFTLVRRAPLGDPLQLKIKNSHISVRSNEAGDIEVELVDLDEHDEQ